MEGSRIFLGTGEVYTLEELLLALLLSSANDAAVAIAHHVAGDTDLFVSMMNAKAVEIGMEDTHFVNPHGLPQAGQQSTALDMGKLTLYALRNPLFRELVATGRAEISWPGKDEPRQLTNHNRLLFRRSDVFGVKTGFTQEAGHCLVAAAGKGNRQVVAVLLGYRGSDLYGVLERMLDYGLENFVSHRVLAAGTEVFLGDPLTGARRTAVLTSDLWASYPVGSDTVISREVLPGQGSRGPQVRVYQGERLLASAPLGDASPGREPFASWQDKAVAVAVLFLGFAYLTALVVLRERDRSRRIKERLQRSL